MHWRYVSIQHQLRTDAGWRMARDGQMRWSTRGGTFYISCIPHGTPIRRHNHVHTLVGLVAARARTWTNEVGECNVQEAVAPIDAIHQ